MRILLATPYRPWDMGRFCERALLRLGHTVEIFDYRREGRVFGLDTLSHIPRTREWGIRQACRRLRHLVDRFQPDLLLVIKGELIQAETIRETRRRGIATILWFPDDPHLFEKVSSRVAPAYDFVFSSSVDALAWYRELGVRHAEWIGFACEPTLHRQVTLSHAEMDRYGCDLCFVGSWYPERSAALRRLHEFDVGIWGPAWSEGLKGDEELLRRYRGGRLPGEEVVKVYSAAKIVLNVHPATQRYYGLRANMRVYEAAGCGAFLLMDAVEGIEQVFRVGEEVVCYRHPEELVELVRHYLQNKAERERIARNAQARAYRDHTYEIRMRQLLSVLG